MRKYCFLGKLCSVTLPYTSRSRSKPTPYERQSGSFYTHPMHPQNFNCSYTDVSQWTIYHICFVLSCHWQINHTLILYLYHILPIKWYRTSVSLNGCSVSTVVQLRQLFQYKEKLQNIIP